MSVLCVVPSAFRASRAARRLCDAEGGVLLDVRVTTLESVAARILATGDGRPVATPLAERIVAGEAASGAFESLGPASGLARSVASILAELRRGNVRPRELRAAAADTDGRRGERLGVIADVLERYESRLSALGLFDGPAAMRAAADALQRGSAAGEFGDLSTLVVDGFHALDGVELDLALALVHRARCTHVRVPYFPDRPDLCARGERWVRSLEALHGLAAERDLTVALEHLDGRPQRLAHVLRGVLGGPATAPSSAGDGIILASSGAGSAGEAERAAGMIANLLDRGFAPEDVSVLGAPGVDADALRTACVALGIPFAAGRGRPLRCEPAIRAIRAALAAAIEGRRSAVEAALSSSYLGLGRPPARFRYWLDRAGAFDERGSLQDTLRRRAATLTATSSAAERSALSLSADVLDAMATALRPLAAPGVPRDHAARLRAFLSRHGVRRRAARGDPDLVRRDLAALVRLDDVLDDLVRALGLAGRGQEQLTAARWAELLDLALDMASAPPDLEPAAAALELWPLSDAPGLGARAAVVVGCSRGAFPAPPATDVLLGDVERTTVNRVAGRLALASASARREDARHGAFCALAAGREALALTWPGAGPDRAASPPAPLAVEALSLAGIDVDAIRAAGVGSTRSSVAQALRSATRHARSAGLEGAVAALGTTAPELARRAASALERGRIERCRQESVASRRAARFAGAVPAGVVAEYHRVLPDQWTPSQLENHARCPFRFFVATVLRLAEPDSGEVDVDPRDEGSLAHAILERFLEARLARRALPLLGRDEERQHLSAVAAELFAQFQADGRTGDPAIWAARRALVLRRLERVIEAEAASGEGAVPALLEYRFGGDAPDPPLSFCGGGHEVLLRGRLDRVDVAPGRLVLIDYKDSKATPSWKKRMQPESLGQVNFQVPAYLMAAARALPGHAELEATYLLLRSAERLPPFVAKVGEGVLAIEDAARAEARAAGITPFADAVVSSVQRIRAGELPIASRDCTGCGFGAVCRFQARAEDTA